VECDLAREQATEERFQAALGDEGDLALFLAQMPKGADLHNHLSGSVYAETYLAWAKEDGYCINTNTKASVFPNQCSASTQPTPGPGPFYDSIVRAWSMLDFVPGAVSGHDHFFSTFGKFGAVAGAHRDESIADFLQRAADENIQHIETMFNNGRNVGTLAASIFSGTVTEDKLEGFYASLLAHGSFAGELQKDVQAVNSAAANYRNLLGCAGPTPPGACGVSVRFIAQVSRTGANDQIFGQLVAAFEMAAKTPHLVGVNLSSPEDDVASLKNYTLHMQMLDFLHKKYTLPGKSPLRVTLHAGELTAKYLPSGYEDALTFHIRQAVELGHAERIGHGIAILSETDSAGLLAEMAKRKVLVEVCLSSNVQILEVSGPAHPLSAYLANKVPVTLASDDLGVSRSSLAGEYARGATAQQLSYKQLKRMARESLEHAFLPGDSLWGSLDDAAPVAPCAPTDEVGLGEELTPACKAFLDQSERAAAQWELERRLRIFESDG
jgi:adenosine deaminase